MNSTAFDALKSSGYVLIKDAILPGQLLEMRNELERHAKILSSDTILYQQEDQVILKSIFSLSPAVFLPLLDMVEVRAVLSEVFKDGYTLQSMNASRANPIGDKNHILRAHIDSRLPVNGIEYTLSLGIAYCIDDFTEENGATRVWPFSHLTGARPETFIEAGLPIPDPIIVKAKAGDIMVFLSHLWHAVGPNRTNDPRWGIFIFFNPWWIKSTWDYTECGEELFNLLTSHQKQLFGFNTQIPSMDSKRTLTKTKIEDLPGDYISAKNIE